jgi:hypothetical protein
MAAHLANPDARSSTQSIMTTIALNLQQQRHRVQQACHSAGRDPASVTLLAVSKTFGPEAVAEAVAVGQRCFGENYVQEGVDKILALRHSHPDVPLDPTLGCWGLGWEVWLNGMEVTQFTYFQQVGGIDCKPITGEITYGLERLAMYLQGVDNVYDLVYTDGLKYGDVFHQNEVEQSTYNFEHSDVDFLLQAFAAHERQSKHLMDQQLALPAYEQLLKAGHSFNLLDARGAISVTERAAYIGRIRNLARAVAQSYVDSRARLGFPMAPKAWADEVLAQIGAERPEEGGLR